MPSIPSSPPSAPSFLPSPLTCLAIFVGVPTVVTGIYVFYSAAGRWMAERRVRKVDVESVGGGSTALVKTRKTNGARSSRCPAEVLFDARTAIFVLKAKGAVEKQEASFHKALMARKGTPAKAKAAKPVQAASSHVRRFLDNCKDSYTPGRIGARRTRSRSGPSPLHLICTAPESVPAPSTALIHILSTPVVAFPAPASPTVPVVPLPSTTSLGAKGPAAIILAALERGDADSSLEYDDDADPSSSISYDAIRGVWTRGGTPPPSPPRVEPDHESSSVFAPPSRSHPPVLVDARLRTLWLAGNNKKRVAETPKRRTRGGSSPPPPPRVEPDHESSSVFAPPSLPHPPVVVDARLRTLWLAGNNKKRVEETPKRRMRGGSSPPPPPPPPPRVEPDHESSSVFAPPSPPHPPVLVDARLRTLWLAGNHKKRVAETPKRSSRSGRVLRSAKENEGTE
ncbi:hypothetical protein K438DRAFT_1862421 [Mycena galopus ATCC 62051]|nr:hypothetical protein K438DRAFT_1862421 [Mycena galopus ATCC 62051]